MKTYRTPNGRYASKLGVLKSVTATLFIVALASGTFKGRSDVQSMSYGVDVAKAEEATPAPHKDPLCFKVKAGQGGNLGEWKCVADPALEAKWLEWEKSQGKKTVEKSVQLKAQETIIRVAEEMGYKDPGFLLSLAYCESRFNPANVNRNGNKPVTSVDRGLFQFNSYWQKRVPDSCAFDAECATRETIKLLQAGKSHLWVCSKIVKAELQGK